MRQLPFFQRLGPIGMLTLLHLIGLAEAILPTLARGEEADAPLEALLFQFWVIVFNICFFLVADISSQTAPGPQGKHPISVRDAESGLWAFLYCSSRSACWCWAGWQYWADSAGWLRRPF